MGIKAEPTPSLILLTNTHWRRLYQPLLCDQVRLAILLLLVLVGPSSFAQQSWTSPPYDCGDLSGTFTVTITADTSVVKASQVAHITLSVAGNCVLGTYAESELALYDGTGNSTAWANWIYESTGFSGDYWEAGCETISSSCLWDIALPTTETYLLPEVEQLYYCGPSKNSCLYSWMPTHDDDPRWDEVPTGIYITLLPDNTADMGPAGARSGCEGICGSPVNLTNGNTYIQQQDYSLPGLGG
jgi:hypothetical protein